MDTTDIKQGLSSSEAKRRLSTDGANELPGGQYRSYLRIVVDAMREPMFLLLFGAGFLYLIIGDLQEGLFLFGMVVLTLSLTLYQEGKTEHALKALRDISSPRALVIRDGNTIHIDSRDLVCGDLIVLSEGDKVSADGLLLSGSGMLVDESLLTGEALSVRKDAAGDQSESAQAGGDDLPYVYAGTLVVQGHGIAQVTATGIHSEIGRIGVALQNISARSSPLHKQISRLIGIFAALGVAMSIVLVLVYGITRGDWLQALLAGIALAMSMLPEEFAVILTVFPALGAWRLARAHVLTRHLSAIETLGTASVLCVDKTGTLTENRMSVASLYTNGEEITMDATMQTDLPEAFHELLEFSILASQEAPFDPMEKAFHRMGTHYLSGTEHLHADWTLAREYTLSPALPAMSHAWKSAGQDAYVIAAKGAPEVIVNLCGLDAETAHTVLAAVDAMAERGLRVLGVAQAVHAHSEWPDSQHDFAFEFIGLIGLEDPLREGIPNAVRQFGEAGIRIIMITGDYATTASAIAKQAGLATGEVLTGEALAKMNEAELRAHIKNVSVCARITPTQKLQIVQALKANGEVVAMTGDGVNDAPALKAAQVGIAMGQRGTDVARESASLVLLDDRFTSIVDAIRSGRTIYNNMKNAMSYVLSMHMPIAGMALLPILLGWPVMLYPMHIVFLELIIDPACSLAFENEAPEANSMAQPPRKVDAALFGARDMGLAFLQGALALAAVMAAYFWAQDSLPEEQARAFAFATLVAANLALIFSNRSRTRTMLESLRTPNPAIWIVSGVALGLLLLALYLPFLQTVFRFAALPAMELLIAICVGMASVLWFEIVKSIRHARKSS